MPKATVALMLLLVICCSFVLSASAKSKNLSSKTSKKKVVYTCQDADRKGDLCPMLYSPVCGYRPDIACITTPCNHVTYANGCEACHDSLVQSYTTGECTQLD